MKTQQHNNELRPLIKEGYAKVYDALRSRISGDDMIFAQWDAGFGDVLQWTLPDDIQWLPLAQADPVEHSLVANEFDRVKNVGLSKLGVNTRLIENVFSVPSEGHVFYARKPQGGVRIMLTAWGYAFPTQPPVTALTYIPSAPTQEVALRFVENGKPAPYTDFEIPRSHGVVLRHRSDANGEYDMGQLEVGESFRVHIPVLDKSVDYIVIKDRKYYTVDLSVKAEESPIVDEAPEEVEEIVSGRFRDISIMFVNEFGQPITSAEILLSQPGNPSLTEGLDSAGKIYLDKSDFTIGVPVTMKIAGQSVYPDAQLVLDGTETEYVVYYKARRKSRIWPAILLLTAAAIVTTAVVYLAIII